MSSPAPPNMRSSYVGCVSGCSFSHVSPELVHVPFGVEIRQPALRLSSAFRRSLPQPPQSVSFPVPPTSQSLPRSPKIASSPSLRASANLLHVVPLFDGSTQPLMTGPSLLKKLRKYCPFTGGAPPRSLQSCPPWIVAPQRHTVPTR